MKKMIFADLLIARSTLLVQIILCIAIGLFVGVATGEVAVTFSVTLAVFAFGHCVGMPVWDEQENWQTMRLAMPISRKEVVLGRFGAAVVFFGIATLCAIVSSAVVITASCIAPEYVAETAEYIAKYGLMTVLAEDILIVWGLLAAILMITCGVFYSLSFRMGMGKAGRYIPAVFAGFFAFVIAVGGFYDMNQLAAMAEDSFLPLVGVFFAFALVVYVVAIMFSLKWYEAREF